MIGITRGLNSSDIEHGSSRVLFVEGNDSSLDSVLMSYVFTDVKVKAIGPSSNIKAASKAFLNVHPLYFFVVDRDHQNDEVVEETWNKFEEGEGNLVIWKKKEIENYFLSPSMLCSSEFIQAGVTEEHIRERLVAYAKEYIYMFTANRVVIRLREELKRNCFDTYKCKEDFPDEATALHQLLQNGKLIDRPAEINELFSSIKSLYREEFDIMVGDGGSLQWGKGSWLDLMPGKVILHQLLNDAQLFKVTGSKGSCIQGKERRRYILSRLLKNENNWPEDFKRLKLLLEKRRLTGTPSN